MPCPLSKSSFLSVDGELSPSSDIGTPENMLTEMRYGLAVSPPPNWHANIAAGTQTCCFFNLDAWGFLSAVYMD